MDREPEIRRLGPGDEALLDRALEALTGRPSAAPDLFLADPRSHALIALDGDRVLGWAVGHELLHPEGRWTLVLYDLRTIEEARSSGIGRVLLDRFAELARDKGHTKMFLFTDSGKDAARLHEGAGAERSVEDGPGFWWVFD